MSCRVISRGVGQVLLSHIMRLGRHASVTLEAEFVPNGRNRMMYVTYKFAGFGQIGGTGSGPRLLRCEAARIPRYQVS